MCFEHLWTLATVWFGTLASLIGSDIWSSQPQGTRKDSSATLADQNIDFRSVHSWQSLNKETLGAVILDQAAEFHPTAFLAEYDKASLERMSQNVTNVLVDLLLFPFVEARKVGPKSHKASFLRQLHSKKMEDGEEMHFLLAPRCGILGKQIVDRRCFLWSLWSLGFDVDLVRAALSPSLSLSDAEAKSRRVASRPCAIPEARKRQVFQNPRSTVSIMLSLSSLRNLLLVLFLLLLLRLCFLDSRWFAPAGANHRLFRNSLWWRGECSFRDSFSASCNFSIHWWIDDDHWCVTMCPMCCNQDTIMSYLADKIFAVTEGSCHCLRGIHVWRRRGTWSA